MTRLYVCTGIEPEGNSVGAPARFIVETFSAGRGKIEVTVLNPRGAKEQVKPQSHQQHPFENGLWCVKCVVFSAK